MLEVSCMCITYGRSHKLNEAVESFLRQDYAGPKELIIVNDMPRQRYFFDHPEITIVNLDKEFANVGEKRNYLASLAKGSVLFPWDDDDISLPHRITQSLSRMQEQGFEDYYILRNVFLSRDNVLVKNTISASAPYHATCAVTREAFNNVNGYDNDNTGSEDYYLHYKLRESVGGTEDTNKEILPTYIYRLGNKGYHLTGHCNRSRITERVNTLIDIGNLKEGEIHLQPQWDKDYLTEAKNFFESNLGGCAV